MSTEAGLDRASALERLSQPIEYVSEWRYQLGATLGLGVDF